MQELKLVSNIPPSVNHYLAYRGYIKNGKPQSMSYKTKEATKYQDDFMQYVKREAEKQGWKMLEKTRHYYIDGVFYFPRTDMDANNYWKVLLDAITQTGIVWPDDNVVCERVQGIYYDMNSPRIELVIRPVNYIGVFENASQMDGFTSVCIGCSRYKRNCSILRMAREGRVQADIVNGRCRKYKENKSEGKENEEQ